MEFPLIHFNVLLGYKHTECQAEHQEAHQAACQASAAVAPIQVYGDVSHDASNRSQSHSQASTRVVLLRCLRGIIPVAIYWVTSVAHNDNRDKSLLSRS